MTLPCIGVELPATRDIQAPDDRPANTRSTIDVLMIHMPKEKRGLATTFHDGSHISDEFRSVDGHLVLRNSC
jgi:hypothetical protein